LLPDGNSAHTAGAVLARSDLVRKTDFVFFKYMIICYLYFAKRALRTTSLLVIH